MPTSSMPSAPTSILCDRARWPGSRSCSTISPSSSSTTCILAVQARCTRTLPCSLSRISRCGKFTVTALRSCRVSSKSSTSPWASTLAVRCDAIVNATSPKKSPNPSFATWLPATLTEQVPSLTKYMPMPMVPCRMMLCCAENSSGFNRPATSQMRSEESMPPRNSRIFRTSSNSLGMSDCRCTPSFSVWFFTRRIAVSML
mmetsp:Transcript_58530/g.119712  ORF Transcript_58530/g.119712 Transcript_58530/m.119712 type:complete len:201 (+) Transcript_58530:743-1345(+)